jgi:hypothetical protein
MAFFTHHPSTKGANMNKSILTTFAAVAITAASAYAQAQSVAAPPTSPAQADAANLQMTVVQPPIEQVLTEPDGVAIALKENGDFQIFARGSGVYDVSDPSELASARTEATLNAKANLAKFIKEKVSVEEGITDVVQKTKTLQGNGQVQTKVAKTEEVKTMAKAITTSAEAILQGVITLREQKAPGVGTGGQIQVTVGISSKTLEAVRRLTGQAPAGMAPAAAPEKNEGYIHNAATDF